MMPGTARLYSQTTWTHVIWVRGGVNFTPLSKLCLIVRSIILIYSFGEWQLDTQLYELRSDNGPIPLEPQVFNVLSYLVEHHDRILSKSELLTCLWPNQFIGDSALERCIMSARKSLGDSGGRQQIIKTFIRRGYRIVVPVTEIVTNLGQTGQRQGDLTSVLSDDVAERSPVCFSRGERPRLTSQRENVTVLSCVLDANHSWREQARIEESEEILLPLNNQISLFVQENNGLITWRSGGSCLALFGLGSLADHAWSAVQAALALQHYSFNGLQEDENGHEMIPLSIGLHSGEVVEKRLGDEAQLIYLAIGDTMQFAVNLGMCAEPGVILASEVTYKMIGEIAKGRIVSSLAGVKSGPAPMATYSLMPRLLSGTEVILSNGSR